MLDVAQNTVGGANPARSFGPTSDEEPVLAARPCGASSRRITRREQPHFWDISA
jgi:hypothetical protein